ncbi:MAG: amino acid permease [Deltaproteobacteria bacterium]|nr:amino acid permease [Deltaproteobacteria bacterium]
MAVTAGFDTDAHGADPRDRLARELGTFDATMLVVSSVIGSGIFLTPAAVAALLPRPDLVLAAWLVGGLLSLAGALANAELGAMYPRAGGDYAYLREGWHPAAGFLVGWLSFFVIYAGTVASLAAAFGEAVAPHVGLGSTGALALAVAATVGTSAVNYVGVRRGVQVNNLGGWLKLGGTALFVGAALVAGGGDAGRLRPLAADGAPSAPLAAFGLALSPVLFTYLGWNAPVYVASEIRDPARTLPRALFLGLGLCLLAYMALNAVYLYALPLAALAVEPNAGAAAAHALFGAAAGRLMGVFVVGSILGTLHATILVGPRIAYAMALDGLFVGGAHEVHPEYRTPHRAIVVQALAAVALLVVLRRFPSVLDYTTFAIVLATMADTAVLYRLRRRRPALRRPYRAWGYPWVPALYLVANGGVALAMLVGRPLECAIGLGVLLAGWPFYAWLRASAR